MSFTNLIANPGRGVELLKYEERICLNKTGAATVVGQLVQFDTFLTQATTFTEGSSSSGTPNSAYNVVVNPGLSGAANGAACTFGLFGIAMEAVNDGKTLRVCIRGHVNAIVRAVTSGKTGYGACVYATNNATNVNRYLGTNPNTNNLKCLGWVEGNYTLGGVSDAADTAEGSYTAGVLVSWPVLFNGIEGMA